MSVVPIRASYSSSLRLRLSELAKLHAAASGAPFCLSYGETPAVCFEPYAEGTQHGNFCGASYSEILTNTAWAARFNKVHTHAGRSLPRREDGTRAELDSCNSSDALLMNIFCYPRVTYRKELAALLQVEPGSEPHFGYKARVPLKSGRADATEVDMRLGDLLVESKLTEHDFQTAPKEKVDRYAHLEEAFDVRELRSRLYDAAPQRYNGYQLIRNVLAAHATGCSFCVIHDARRPDLRDQWFAVMSCIKHSALSTRCKVLTWQELAVTLPPTLCDFLARKYGIADH
jgi:hypothetical protein